MMSLKNKFCLLSIFFLFIPLGFAFDLTMVNNSFFYKVNLSELPFVDNINFSVQNLFNESLLFNVSSSNSIVSIVNPVLNVSGSSNGVVSLLVNVSSVISNTSVLVLGVSVNSSFNRSFYFGFVNDSVVNVSSIFPSSFLEVNGSTFHYVIYDVELPFSVVNTVKLTVYNVSNISFVCGQFLVCPLSLNVSTPINFFNVSIKVPFAVENKVYVSLVNISAGNKSAQLKFNLDVRDTPVILYNMTTKVVKPMDEWSVADWNEFLGSLDSFSEKRILELLEANRTRILELERNISVPVPVVLNASLNKWLLQIDYNYDSLYEMVKSFVDNRNDEIARLSKTVSILQIENDERQVYVDSLNVSEIKRLAAKEALNNYNLTMSKSNRGWKWVGWIGIVLLLVGGVVYVKKMFTSF